MYVPFKERIKLDKFLSDAQRECVEHFGCWLRDKHFSRGPVQHYVRAAKQVLCWANYAGIGIEDLNSKRMHLCERPESARQAEEPQWAIHQGIHRRTPLCCLSLRGWQDPRR